MNQTNRYIANLYVVMLHLRDTLEFCIDREHPVNIYEARKQTITSGVTPGSAFKGFFDSNGEKGKEIEDKLKESLQELYSDDSTVLKVAGDIVRVDHTQHLKIYDYTVGIVETLRDVINLYIQHTKQEGTNEECMEVLLKTDEALYRSVAFKLILVDLERSFLEFNKVMQESGGKPTPQSNFIVQNEIIKYTQHLRFIRAHCHLTDNKTLDLLDEVLELVEMTEGRRDRRDNKPFGQLFQEAKTHLDNYIIDAEKAWKEAYSPILNEMIELAKAQQAGESTDRTDN